MVTLEQYRSKGSKARQSQSEYPLSSLPGDWRLWNEAIGLPILPATNQPHELLQFQNDIGEYPGKDVIVNKANKEGITETFLRKLLKMSTEPGGALAGYDVILGSSQDELAEENLRRMENICLNSDRLRSMVKEAIVTRMLLTNSTRFLTMPSNPSALRSWPRVKAVFLDEAGHLGKLDDTEYFSAASSRLANTDGYMYIVSTPHGQRGFFYNLWMKAVAGEVEFKTYTLHYSLGMGVFYTEEFIAKEKSRLGPLFAQEYENAFIASGSAAIEPELVDTGTEDYEVR